MAISISMPANSAPQTPISAKVTELRAVSEDAFNTALNLANRLSTILNENLAAQPPSPAAEQETTVCELHERLHSVLTQVHETVSLLQRITNAVQL